MPVFAFGAFVLDTDAYRLTRDGQPVRVSPRPLDLLAYLVARPAQLVTRDELFRQLWSDVIVTDNALTQLVSELRQVLGDPPGAPVNIQTVARRGYRFMTGVSVAERPAHAVPTSAATFGIGRVTRERPLAGAVPLASR